MKKTKNKWTKRRSFLAIALVAVIGLIAMPLTGCDNGSTDTDDGNTPTGQTPVGQTPDDTPVDSNQTPVAGDYTFGNMNQTENSVTAVTITPKTGKSPGTVSNIKYADSTTIPQTVGTYAVTFDVAAATGWNAATGLSAGTLSVTAALITLSADDYVITGLSHIYDGSGKQVNIVPKTGKSTGARTIWYEGRDGTEYTKKQALPSNIGTYTVTFDVAAAGDFPSAVGLFAGVMQIANQVDTPAAPVEGDFDVGELSFTYDGSGKRVSVTPKENKSGGVITVKYGGATTLPINAGTYTVTFDVGEAVGWSAQTGLSAGTLTINKATPVAGDFNVSLSGNTVTYDGSSKSVTVTATPKTSVESDGTVSVAYYEGTGGTSYTKSTTAPTNVGTYAVTFNVAEGTNHLAATGLSAGTLTINKATPVAGDYDTSMTASQEAYPITAPATVTVKTSGVRSNGAVTVYYTGTWADGTAHPKNAGVGMPGTYTVTFDVAAASDGNWNAATGLSVGTLTLTAPVFTSITDFGTWLGARAASTDAVPYYQVELNVTGDIGTTGSGSNPGSAGQILKNNSAKKVILDFSGTSNLVTQSFQYCDNLVGVIISGTVTAVYGSSGSVNIFRNCTNLTSVNILNGFASIPNYMFQDCTSLTSVTIPASVTSIGQQAFYNCTSLASVTIPNGVTSIETNAFYNCNSLASVTIPASVTSIGGNAFSCTNLTSVTFQGTIVADNLGSILPPPPFTGGTFTSPFRGDLRDKYLAGGTGTYRTTAPVSGTSVWTK